MEIVEILVMYVLLFNAVWLDAILFFGSLASLIRTKHAQLAHIIPQRKVNTTSLQALLGLLAFLIVTSLFDQDSSIAYLQAPCDICALLSVALYAVVRFCIENHYNAIEIVFRNEQEVLQYVFHHGVDCPEADRALRLYVNGIIWTNRDIAETRQFLKDLKHQTKRCLRQAKEAHGRALRYVSLLFSIGSSAFYYEVDQVLSKGGSPRDFIAVLFILIALEAFLLLLKKAADSADDYMSKDNLTIRFHSWLKDTIRKLQSSTPTSSTKNVLFSQAKPRPKNGPYINADTSVSTEIGLFGRYDS